MSPVKNNLRVDTIGDNLDKLSIRGEANVNSPRESRSNNPAVKIEHEIYKNPDFGIDSDEPGEKYFRNNEESSTDDSNESCTSKMELNEQIVKKQVKLAKLTPEMIEKNKEAYQNWLKVAKEKERHKKVMEKKNREAEEKAKLEKQHKSEMKMKEWKEKKEAEMANLKKTPVAGDINKEARKSQARGIPFDEWVQKKINKTKDQKNCLNNNVKESTPVKREEETGKFSLEKWTCSSKSKPKPVPLNRGLDSLRGATTKTFINPKAWID